MHVRVYSNTLSYSSVQVDSPFCCSCCSVISKMGVSSWNMSTMYSSIIPSIHSSHQQRIFGVLTPCCDALTPSLYHMRLVSPMVSCASYSGLLTLVPPASPYQVLFRLGANSPVRHVPGHLQFLLLYSLSTPYASSSPCMPIHVCHWIFMIQAHNCPVTHILYSTTI